MVVRNGILMHMVLLHSQDQVPVDMVIMEVNPMLRVSVVPVVVALGRLVIIRIVVHTGTVVMD